VVPMCRFFGRAWFLSVVVVVVFAVVARIGEAGRSGATCSCCEGCSSFCRFEVWDVPVVARRGFFITKLSSVLIVVWDQETEELPRASGHGDYRDIIATIVFGVQKRGEKWAANQHPSLGCRHPPT
jgi:hypothetical protein